MDDIISRQQAIDTVRTVIGDNRSISVCEAIKKLPPIQPVNTSETPNSSDVISRQAAIEAVQNRHMMLSKEKVLLINDLEKLPSAQPEIVRCKDCKHWIPYDWMFSEVWRSKNMADYPEDEIGCNWCDMTMKADDFCSRAERREVTT